MKEGISVEEACRGVSSASYDRERTCGKNGILGHKPNTTTFTLSKDGTKSITINNTYLQIGGAIIFIAVIATIGLTARRLNRKKSAKQTI